MAEINISTLQDRLGINTAVWQQNKEEWMPFLEQGGARFEPRKSFIPEELVEKLQKKFTIQPVKKRAPRTSSRKADEDLDTLDINGLLKKRERLEAALEALKAKHREEQAELRNEISDIDRHIRSSKATADRRVAEAEALLERVKAEAEALANVEV